MVDGWSVTTLAEEADLLTGFPFKSALYSEHPEGVPLLRGDNIAQGHLRWDGVKRWPASEAGSYHDYLLESGDLVLAMDRPWIEAGLKFARVRPSDTPALLVQRVARLRGRRESLDTRFLYYLIGSAAFTQHVLAVQTGTAVPHVSGRQILEFPFHRPPLAEQRAIAATLGALDDKIELNQRMVRTLHEAAWTMFATRYRHGPNREQWSMEGLARHVEAVRGLSYTGAGLTDGQGLPLHNLDSVYEGGGYKRKGIKWYVGGYKERHLVRPGDVVLANTEQGFEYLLIAYPAIIPKRFGEGGLFSHHLYRVRPRSDSSLTSRFLYFLLLRGALRTEIAGYANGTTVNMLPRDALERPQFHVPPAEVVREIDALTAPLHERAELAEDESETLAALRNTLLPKLISGDVRVREAEDAVEAAT